MSPVRLTSATPTSTTELAWISCAARWSQYARSQRGGCWVIYVLDDLPINDLESEIDVRLICPTRIEDRLHLGSRWAILEHPGSHFLPGQCTSQSLIQYPFKRRAGSDSWRGRTDH